MIRQAKNPLFPWTDRSNLYNVNNAMRGSECGTGFVQRVDGSKSHQAMQFAREMLECQEHRGGCSTDKTVDGAGVATRIPHKLMRLTLAKPGVNVQLNHDGDLGVAMIFFCEDSQNRSRAVKIIEGAVRGAEYFGPDVKFVWRDVTFDAKNLPQRATKMMPVMRQLLIVRPSQIPQNEFENRLTDCSTHIFQELAKNDLHGRGNSGTHVVSMSSECIVYKGMIAATELFTRFADLTDTNFETDVAIVHVRFATNSFPFWEFAQPFALFGGCVLAHNGEINTNAGAKEFYAQLQRFMETQYGEEWTKFAPFALEGWTDSAVLNRVLNLIVRVTGLPVYHALMMMVPPAWEKDDSLPQVVRDFWQYVDAVSYRFDGPANLVFFGKEHTGAQLDQNGLRPARYTITKDGWVFLASEQGALRVEPSNVQEFGRLGPSLQHLVVTPSTGQIRKTTELVTELAHGTFNGKGYGDLFNPICPPKEFPQSNSKSGWWSTVGAVGKAFRRPFKNGAKRYDRMIQLLIDRGWDRESIDTVLRPMILDGTEALSCMPDDVPLAALSDLPRSIFDYFKQVFAQVTNPAIDPIREKLVMTVTNLLGPRSSLLRYGGEVREMIKTEHAVMEPGLFKWFCEAKHGLKVKVVYGGYVPGELSLSQVLDRICFEVEMAIDAGAEIVVYSDRCIDEAQSAVDSLIATGAIHQHLIKVGKRPLASLVVESGSARETHHIAMHFGLGADALYPWAVFYAIEILANHRPEFVSNRSVRELTAAYVKSADDGLMKIMAKIGVANLRSYIGSLLFDAWGLESHFKERCFAKRMALLKGNCGYDHFDRLQQTLHAAAFDPLRTGKLPDYALHGYSQGPDAERHSNTPQVVHSLLTAVRTGDGMDHDLWSKYFAACDRDKIGIRRDMRIQSGRESIPLEQVQPVEEILWRLLGGAMSYGSISKEAHETNAAGTNRLAERVRKYYAKFGTSPIAWGPFQNTGEGGSPDSAIVITVDSAADNPTFRVGDDKGCGAKQVASGRFGVTIFYLCSGGTEELQIKISQGAKPGEGGELPGNKVDKHIAAARHSTPGVGLISPPPHHDIYSIEDLAQLIHDLKKANPDARISVKLASALGSLNAISAGVVKAGADDVEIAGGQDGGSTGASKLASIRHVGGPFETGVAETRQTLVLEDLRSRATITTSGGIRSPFDILIAFMLGADRVSMGLPELMALGCVLTRQCHLGTCPVGIATQDEELRKRFLGRPEHTESFFLMLAEGLRWELAKHGFTSVEEVIGHPEHIQYSGDLDFEALAFHPSDDDHPFGGKYSRRAEHRRNNILPVDNRFDDVVYGYIEQIFQPQSGSSHDGHVDIVVGQKERIRVTTSDRTGLTRTSCLITRYFGGEGLINSGYRLRVRSVGELGQSFSAWLAGGITHNHRGTGNDGVLKGMCRGSFFSIRPEEGTTFDPHVNVIVGNAALYGATGGMAHFCGTAGERFCVRNSGATATVEGVGDHGLEYMTGGRVLVLGTTGRNFASGMSGGLAFVYDEDELFSTRVNLESVRIEQVQVDDSDVDQIRDLVQRHEAATESKFARGLLDDWFTSLPRFYRVLPLKVGEKATKPVSRALAKV